jgi:hypothetical protein
MKSIKVNPGLWIEAGAGHEKRHEADVAGGGSWVVRESVRTTGAKLSATREGVRVEFAVPADGADAVHGRLYDSSWRCMLEATVAACKLPADWRAFARLDVDLTVLDAPVDLEWVVVGARSRLMDRRVCRPGRCVLSVDTREIPLIQGKQPPWEPVAIRLAARPANGEARTVVVHGIELHASKGPVLPVVDRLGQRKHRDWPGKMRDKSEFARDLARESAELDAAPKRADRDEFLGWTEGPRFKPGAFFRVEQDDAGRWWYVTPHGHPYWCYGTTGVRLVDNTSVEGREELFEEIPPREFPGKWREDGSVCFYGTNALTKYGSEEAWAQFTGRRLLAWGVTGIGNWSDLSVLKARKAPGTWDLSSRVGPALLGRLPDVFDARWAPAFEAHLKERTAPWIGDPWLVGWFVDNELPWGHARLLDAPADAAVRGEWSRVVRDRYADPSGFRADTGCACATWEAIAALDEAGLGASPAADELRASLTGHYTKKYFSEVRRVLKSVDPDHLYLGCRFVRGLPHEAVVRASSVCDVVTVNSYSLTPERWRFDEWHRLCGRPIQIGEHQYALYGDHLPPPIWPALTAEERRRWFPEYVRGAASMPYCVGDHWFQYVDQAGTGRPSNGENMAIGWIDVVDRPHDEMIEAVREAGNGIYEWHNASR